MRCVAQRLRIRASPAVRPPARRHRRPTSYETIDGRWILFHTYQPGGDPLAKKNIERARVRSAGGEPELLTAGWDEHLILIDWSGHGIKFTGNIRTTQSVYLLNPESLEIARKTFEPNATVAVSASADGDHLAMLGFDGRTAWEIYRADASDYQPVRLTDISAAIDDRPQHQHEIIQWKAQDSVVIHGVLYKPKDHDPGKRYALFIQIHGGPVHADKPQRLINWGYPTQQWLDKGAQVLMPNYRGSNGYGHKFRSYGYRDSAIDAAKDIVSAVDHLVAEGNADPGRVGAMGWSHGGYLSAFLVGISDKFNAISVGAGPSRTLPKSASADTHPAVKLSLGPGRGGIPNSLRQILPMRTWMAPARRR